MNYIKTYEGLFDFLKKKKKIEPVPEISIKQQCDDITEEIIDSMWDILDKYDATDSRSSHLPGPGKMHWRYNYTQLNNGSLAKCGIIILGVADRMSNEILQGGDGANILRDINEIIPVINNRTGIVLNKPHVGEDRFASGLSGLVIDFPAYMSANRRRRGW